MNHNIVRTLLAAMLLLLCGCESPTNTSGIVRFTDGEAVESGSIELRSVDDGARYASRIAKDGSFSLTDKDGDSRCPPGQYEAVVVQIVLTEHLAAEDHDHGRTVPRRYADYYTSGLRVTNSGDANTPLVVELKPE